MSDTNASCSPVNQDAPEIDAAGPDKIVSIGFSRATSADTKAPSPRTTIRRASIPTWAKWPSQALINPSIIPIKRAFSTAVNARFGPPNADDSSCEQVTGFPVKSRIRSRAATSCAALRVAKLAAMANPVTPTSRPRTTLSNAAKSNGTTSVPAWEWPPANAITGSPRNASVRPARPNSAGSNPINTSAMRPPWPSTNAFVASVVDRDTIATSAGSIAASANAASIAAPTPTAKSGRDVSALALAKTASVTSSKITASVYVPPVSTPKRYAIQLPSHIWQKQPLFKAADHPKCDTSGRYANRGAGTVTNHKQLRRKRVEIAPIRITIHLRAINVRRDRCVHRQRQQQRIDHRTGTCRQNE